MTSSDGEENKHLKTEVEVKLENAGEGGEFTGQPGGANCDQLKSEYEKKRQFLIKANQQLRKAIVALSRRQEVLEEFIDVEYDEKAFWRYSENKQRFMYVLGYSEDDVGVTGQRNEKYKRIVNLMGLVKDYWIYERSNFARPVYEHMVVRYEAALPQELKDLRVHVDYDTGLIGRKPIKKCHKCYDTTHGMKSCPYKKAVARTPEIVAAIKQRIEEWKKVEGPDPLISKGYKRKHYKINEARDRRRAKREEKFKMKKKNMKQEQKEDSVDEEEDNEEEEEEDDDNEASS